jgi:hypothetical protein
MNKIIKKKSRISPTSYMNISVEAIKKTNKSKISDEQFMIPDITEYNYILKHNFKIPQLKKICKYYKIKQTGNKEVILNRVYKYLRLSHSCYIIQKMVRRFFYRQYENSQGPARNNRSICVNETDFFTMEKLLDIEKGQFFSIEDDKGHIYGFDILSIWNLFLKNGRKTENPYNRIQFHDKVYHKLCIFLNYSQIFNKSINLVIKMDEENLSPEKRIEIRALSIFQYIDGLGNYTNITWFNNLTNSLLIKFLRELQDIWCYRAQLSDNIKREICPPVGNPFISININTLTQNMSILELKKKALSVIEQIVKTGTNQDNQSLGAFYVLSALTLVSLDAANALPWLYQSVSLA